MIPTPHLATDRFCARLIQSQYGYPGFSAEFLYTYAGQPYYSTFPDADGITNVVFRGSSVPLDFILDFSALAIPTAIGMVHAGFWFGIESACENILLMIEGPIRITGHSKGAAQANLAAEYMAHLGRPPVELVKFAEPMSRFARTSGIPQRSYRNRLDPVYDVPLFIPPLLPYAHSCEPTMIDVPPTAAIELAWSPFLALKRNIAWHNIALYSEALETPA